MQKVNMEMVMAKKAEFATLEDVKKAIRVVQSRKTRTKAKKGLKNYEELMTAVLQEEQLLKEVRDAFEPKSTPVTQFTKSDIENLDYDQTMKAIKSIQSKKTHTQFLTDDIETNEQYQRAIKIEEMLLDHKSNVKPIDCTTVRKTSIEDLMKHIATLEQEIPKEHVLELLENLIK